MRTGLLGVGGMGRVYLAHDRRLGRMVALKEAHDEGLARRLAREVRVTAGLEHPGIVTVYDEGRGGDGRRFYTMRLMRGRPLSRVLARCGTMAERLALLRHYLDACQALAYAHAHAVIHRDLKPANIMVGAFGETQVVDWGLARRLEGEADVDVDLSATRTGAVIGTPAYMSPEQARGEPADRRSDVWGLGAVLHEILAGTPPVCGETSLADGAATLPLRALVPEAPAELAAIVARTLAPDPEARYADASALAADVGAYLEGRRVHAHRYSGLEIALRFVRVWRVPLLIIGAALAVIATLLVLGNLSLRAQRDRARTAEAEMRTALATSDRNLAAALVAQARAADDRGANAQREVIAAHALQLVDSPEARGLVAGARAAGRPTRLATAPLPECFPLVLLSVDDVVCADPTSLRRVTAGVEVWRVATAKPTKELRVEAGRVWAVAAGFTNTTVSLATGAPDPETWAVFDLNVGDAWPVRALVQPRIDDACGVGHPVGLSGHVDGPYAILCGDGRLGLAAGVEVAATSPVFDPLEFVSFTHMQLSPDARRVVVAGTRGRVAVHDFETGETWTLQPARPHVVRRLALAPAGDRVAVVRERGGVDLYELPALRPLGTIAASNVGDARVLADGSVLVGASDAATQWSLPATPRPGILTDEHGLSSLAFAPDGRTLVTTHGEGRVLVWDLATGTRRHALALGAGTVKASAFLGDGSGFAIIDVNSDTPGPRIFDVASGVLRWQAPPLLLDEWLRGRGREAGIERPAPMVGRRVAVLAGDVVVAALYAPGLFTADVDDDTLVPITDCPRIEWQDLAGAPEGRRAVVVSVDATAFVIDPGMPLRCRAVSTPAGTNSADVSADGATVVFGGSRFLALAGPGEQGWRVVHPGTWPLDVALSPDGRRVATAGPDDAARVWDAADGTLRAVLTGHDGRVSAVEFSPDGGTLATGSWDGAARLWDLATLDLPAATIVREAEATWGLSLADALAE